jgi:hypothetical protein
MIAVSSFLLDMHIPLCTLSYLNHVPAVVCVDTDVALRLLRIQSDGIASRSICDLDLGSSLSQDVKSTLDQHQDVREGRGFMVVSTAPTVYTDATSCVNVDHVGGIILRSAVRRCLMSVALERIEIT